MAITIKRTKLTLKAPVTEAPTVDPEPSTEATVAEPASLDEGGGKPRVSVFQIVVLIIAICTFLFFLSLVVIQALELSFYKAPPTAFAEFTPQAVAPTPAPEPAVTTTTQPPVENAASNAAPVAPEAAAATNAAPATDAAAPATPPPAAP